MCVCLWGWGGVPHGWVSVQQVADDKCVGCRLLGMERYLHPLRLVCWRRMGLGLGPLSSSHTLRERGGQAE